MIPAGDFCDALARRGVGFASGVPCSYLSGPISRLTSAGRYVAAANEGAAVALACGAAAGGERAAVFAQNSGFGNLINPLTSLQATYGIPLLVFMSLRGWPDPLRDEPQHEVMGTSTHAMLDVLGVAHWTLEPSLGSLEAILHQAGAELEAGRSAFVLVPKGSIEGAAGGDPDLDPDRLTRTSAIEALLPRLADLPIVSTTGYISRSLFAVQDRPANFYMQGSMGHAPAFALGLALSRRQRVVVFDGDGAALMHLGTMSTIGAAAPVDLVHVIFDNRVYESTGAQPTTSASTDFAAIATGAGYASAQVCVTAAEISAALDTALASPGPHLLAVRVGPAPGAAPPRATSALPAAAIFSRFSDAVGTGSPWQRAAPVPAIAMPAVAVPADGRPADLLLAAAPAAATPPAQAAAHAAAPAAETVAFGIGALDRLRGAVLRYAPQRILVVASDRRYRGTGIGGLLTGFQVRLFSDFTCNPTLDQVLHGCAVADSFRPDLIIGVGGGSTMDVAKAIRVLDPDRDRALACLAGDATGLRGSSCPLILVPTTAGTGSEVTQFATLFVGLAKASLDHPSVAADQSIVDPLLTWDCPPKVSSSCAMDSLSHAVESLWSATSTARSRIFAEEALGLLKEVVGQPLEQLTLSQRETLSLASLQAGRAINLTRTTAAHAFAYRLTSEFSVPHGVACITNLRWLYDYNCANVYSAATDARGADFVCDRLMDVAKILGVPSEDVSAALRDMLAVNGWPVRLRDFGVAAGDLTRLAGLGIGHAGRADRNPVALDRELIVDRLTRML